MLRTFAIGTMLRAEDDCLLYSKYVFIYTILLFELYIFISKCIYNENKIVVTTDSYQQKQDGGQKLKRDKLVIKTVIVVIKRVRGC